MNQAALKRIFSEAFRLSAEGRTSRKMFWLAQVVYMVIYFAVIAVTFPFGQFGQMVSLAVSLVILVFSWLLMIRRLHDITIQAWSPLQFGMFKGCFVDHPDFPELNRVLGELGEKYGVSKTAIAIAWILRHPAHIQVISGTMNPVHMKEFCDSTKVELTHNEWYKLYLFLSYQLTYYIHP